MRCPKCGTQNGADFKFCKECAYPLQPDASSTKKQPRTESSVSSPDRPVAAPFPELNVPEDIFADFDDDFDMGEPVARGGKRGTGPAVPEVSARRVSFFDDDDTNDPPDAIERKKDDAPSGADNSPGLENNTRTYNWDEDDYDYEEVSMKRKKQLAPRRKASPKNKKNIALWITIAIVLAVLITVFALFLSSSYEGSFTLFFNTTFTSAAITKNAEVFFGETETGDPAVLIKVYARKGFTVRFQEGELIQDTVVTGTSVTFCVPQSIWIPGSPVESSVLTVNPTVYVIDPNNNGEVIQVKIDPVEITLPSVIITLDKPETSELITSDDTVEIAGSVSDPAVAVFIGDTQLQMDQNGYFRGIYHMDALGEHEVFIEARKPGAEVVRSRLLITYTKTDLALTVTNESMRTFEDTIEITGIMDRGAQLSVSGIQTVGEVNADSENGTFSFIANVPDVGLYTPTLSLTAGNVTSSITIYIEHAPDIDSYRSSARAFDYEDAISHSTMDRRYEIRGTIVSVEQTDPYVIATMLTRDGDYLTFRYYHTTTVEANDGKDYRIYAYPTGTDSDGGLLMYCWFIYKSE